jgi:glycosyl transferase family 25
MLYFFILSVPEDESRRTHSLSVKEKLDKYPSSSCIIFDSIYWKTNDVIKGLNEQGISLYPIGDSYAISQSQIGCFLSHYLLWKKISELSSQDKFIILEDDMDLNDIFNYDELSETLDTQYDAIILWKHPARTQETHSSVYNNYLTHFYSQWGTTAYSITPKFARTLIHEIKSINRPIDLILHNDIYPKHNVYICSKEHFINFGDLGTGTNPNLKFKSLIFS